MKLAGVQLGWHAPQRPEWVCRSCRAPYPCLPGREWLTMRYGHGADLGEAAFVLLEQAVADLGRVPVAELYERFVEWTGPAHSEPLAVLRGEPSRSYRSAAFS